MAREPGLVLLDFDGTLADSLEVAVDAYNDVAPLLRVPRISANDSRLRRMNPREALREQKIPLWKLPVLVTAIRTRLRDRMDRVPLFPGIPEALADLSGSGLRCGIVSSNSRGNIERVLARHRLDGVEILGAGAGLFGKARMLRSVLRDQRTSAANAVYVGDEVRDIVAAAEIGMRSVAVTWGYAAGDALVDARPDVVVERPERLASAIFEGVFPDFRP